jgi:NAD(P)-dependent dehydrogenase (short-subunit alcohol dehydrogenase family)
MKLIQLVVVFTALVLSSAFQQTVADDSIKQKAILVTGTSTGIGRNIAETLAAAGYYVYAGARKDKDLAELDAIENVQSIRLDVTSQEDIDAAVEIVRNGGKGLYGLVNNAGVAVFGGLTQTSDSDLEFVFDVNVFGVVRVTRAFAPLIVEQKGRIVTTGSTSGILSSSIVGVYSMSKHAIEAFTDSLAAELRDTGVGVSVVEPGDYKSQIRQTAASRREEAVENAGGALSERERHILASIVESGLSLEEPDEVSAAVMHALFSDTPKRRYMVVSSAGEAERTIRKAIEELVQLNEGHIYSYNRDRLVEMLDEALTQ